MAEPSEDAFERTEVSTLAHDDGDDDGDDGDPRQRSDASRLATPRIGRFAILRKLGQGGMGVVYAGYDETLDRKVAIKLLRLRTGEAARRRLAREAQALARLSHPNVVQVYEIGLHGDASYIAMEYVDGQTLGAWAKSEPRSWPELLARMIDAGRGLAAAHRKGLVHRDFKPENVMIDGEGRVRVMDFGLVHGALASDELDAELAAAGDEPREPSQALLELDEDVRAAVDHSQTASRSLGDLGERLTKTGSTLGTPAYMPPEQHAGRTTDARSDQFSFCVALWELLYGQRPFAGRSLGELYLAVSTHKLSEPPKSDVPGWLRKIVERGLAADPSARWQDMDELLAALSDDPRRRRGFLAGISAVLVLALGGVGLRSVVLDRQREQLEAACAAEGAAIDQLWNDTRASAIAARFEAGTRPMPDSWARTRSLIDDYAHAWSAARVHGCRATQIEHTRTPEAAARTSACLDQARVALAATLDVLEATDGAAGDDQQLSPELAAYAPRLPHRLPRLTTCQDDAALARQPPELDTAELATMRTELQHASARALVGELEQALRQASHVAEQAAAAERPALEAEAQLSIADAHEAQAHYAAAEQAYTRAFMLAGQAGADDSALRASIAMTYLTGVTLSKLEVGRVWASVAQMQLLRLGDDSSDAASWWSASSALERVAGKLEQAQTSAERALALHEQTLGPTHPDVATALIELAKLDAERERFDEALALIDRALRIREDAYGAEHPDVAAAISTRGDILEMRGQFDAARSQFQLALRMREAMLGPEHPDVASSLVSLGVLDMRTGNPAAALPLLDRALEIREAALGPEHQLVGALLNSRAAVHYRLDNTDLAIADNQRAVDIIEQALGPEHPLVATALINLAMLLLERARHDDAQRAAERARAIFEASYGPDHSNVANALAALGTVLEARGDLRGARAQYQHALAVYERALGPDHFDLSDTLFLIGESSRLLGEHQQAVESLERALKLELAAGAGGERTSETRVTLAEVYWALGQREQARAHARAALDDLRAVDGSAERIADIEQWLVDTN